jgi:hypothetical protein
MIKAKFEDSDRELVNEFLQAFATIGWSEKYQNNNGGKALACFCIAAGYACGRVGAVEEFAVKNLQEGFKLAENFKSK